jgi:hypothetical protein
MLVEKPAQNILRVFSDGFVFGGAYPVDSGGCPAGVHRWSVVDAA